jgi:hypothetical protein
MGVICLEYCMIGGKKKSVIDLIGQSTFCVRRVQESTSLKAKNGFVVNSSPCGNGKSRVAEVHAQS